MDFNSSSGSSQFSGFLPSDIPAKYQDNNEGQLYSVVETCLGETIVISFLSQTAFDNIMAHLSRIYTFTPNKVQTGQTATTNLGTSKIVITAYTTNKLVIQGRDGKLWMDTIFRTLDEKLSETNKINASDSRPKQPELRKLTKSKSTGVLNSISKFFLGPPLNNELVKLGKELKKAKKSAKKGKTEVDYEELRNQVAAIQETGVKPNKKLHKMNKKVLPASPVKLNFRNYRRTMDPEETNVKTVLNSTEIEHTISSNPLSHSSVLSLNSVPQSEDEKDTEAADSETPPNQEIVPSHKEPTLPAADSHSQHHFQESHPLSLAQIEILQEEMKRITEENRNLRIQNNRQVNELNKLKQKQKNEKSESCATNQEIAETTSKMLILEEENLKLKNNNKSLIAENKKCEATIRQTSSTAETSEDILSRVSLLTDEVHMMRTMLCEVQKRAEKSATEADIRLLNTDLRNTIKQEIASLKLQITSEQLPVHIEQTNQTTESSTEPDHQSSSNAKVKEDGKKTVYMIGDSVTKVLDPKRLSGDKYSVAVKTNPGATVQTVKSKIQSIVKQDKRLANCDIVLLHTGINNVTDAEPASEIVRQYEDLISTTRSINKNAKIIVSSILPKQQDKLSLPTIMEVNTQLKSVCASDNQLYFMDNTSRFKTNNTVNESLYSNETQLSSKGAGCFAQCIKNAIHSCLNITFQTKTKPRGGNFHQPQMKGTRYRKMHGRLPPWTRMPQYWSPYPLYH